MPEKKIQVEGYLDTCYYSDDSYYELTLDDVNLMDVFGDAKLDYPARVRITVEVLDG